MVRRALGAAGLAVAAALAVGGCSPQADRPQARYQVADRQPAPKLSGELLGGGSYELAAQRGTVVVVNFWASWCAPCRDEAAELDAAYASTRPAGVAFLGINVRDERDKALAFQTRARTPYPSLFDPAGQSALDFKVPPNTIPATLVIDRQGRLAAVFRKALLREELTTVVDQIAREQP